EGGDGVVTLSDALGLGTVHLTVSDAARSTDWYRRALGLDVTGDETLVRLHEDRGAERAGRHAGLYHYALLFPSREELARAVLRVSAAQTPVQGMSDHGTHEAVYLPDPDGNGIELAADRPRDEWPTDAYAGGPAPLDLDSLLATVRGEEPAPAAEGLRV